MRNLLLALSLLSSCITFAEHDDLAYLIGQRLSYMQAVAAHKWKHKLPVTDIAREKLVIKSGVIAGLNHGITRQSSEKFYRSQIEAAKTIQNCWHKRWSENEKPRSFADLNHVIRPILLNLGEHISAKLSEPRPDLMQFEKALRIECLSSNSKRKILFALGQIKEYPSRFEQVRDSGVLRVGTTGDYAPFSLSDDGVTFTGIDIDLAHELAKYLGASVTFVKTTWPTLLPDFAARKFDVGMSGISITEERKQHALFSDPYHMGGKTPIARCEQVNSFRSLATIDQPNTRIIVNPGGTNEIFLDRNIRNAKKILFEDNREIFRQIVEGNADLMITDRIEVLLQSALHPQLCGLPNETSFTYQEKGYLVPREPKLLKVVNEWLQEMKQKGTLRKAFEYHLTVK